MTEFDPKNPLGGILSPRAFDSLFNMKAKYLGAHGLDMVTVNAITIKIARGDLHFTEEELTALKNFNESIGDPTVKI